jgi:hypothetical protein
MVFPKLDAEPVIDSTIDDCWHGKYQSIAALSETPSTRYGAIDANVKAMTEEEFVAQREYCRKMVEQGVLLDD